MVFRLSFSITINTIFLATSGPFSFLLSAHLFSGLLVRLLSSLPSTSSLSQLLRKFSSCMALYYLTTSPSSFGYAPLSCSIFFVARLHRPF